MPCERANSSRFHARRVDASLSLVDSQENFTLNSGARLEEGDGVVVLTRAAGTSEEFFTRGKEFVPERYCTWDNLFQQPPVEKESTAAQVYSSLFVFGAVCPCRIPRLTRSLASKLARRATKKAARMDRNLSWGTRSMR